MDGCIFHDIKSRVITKKGILKTTAIMLVAGVWKGPVIYNGVIAEYCAWSCGGRACHLRYLGEESPPVPVPQFEVGRAVPLHHPQRAQLLLLLQEGPVTDGHSEHVHLDTQVGRDAGHADHRAERGGEREHATCNRGMQYETHCGHTGYGPKRSVLPTCALDPQTAVLKHKDGRTLHATKTRNAADTQDTAWSSVLPTHRTQSTKISGA